MVSSPEKPQNHPIYSVETDISSSIFYNDFSLREEKQEIVDDEKKLEEDQQGFDEGLWNMSLDGAMSKEGAGSGVWIISLDGISTLHYFKLAFECTNTEEEYGAHMSGLKLLIEEKDKRIIVQGDLELIIKQVQGT